MEKMKSSAFDKDLFRYYGDQKVTLLKRLFFPPQVRYLYFFRKASASKTLLAKLYYKLMLRHLENVSHIQIPIGTQIGEGLYIGHHGFVIVNPKAVLGRNINIAAGVTIGQTNRGKNKGAPCIADNCWIGTNAIIVGNVRIGADVLIAPGAYVNFDVPDHSVVIGNPGKIIHKDRATEGYINRTV